MKKTILCILCALLLAGCVSEPPVSEPSQPSETVSQSESSVLEASSASDVSDTSSTEQETPESDGMWVMSRCDENSFFEHSHIRVLHEHADYLAYLDSLNEWTREDWGAVLDQYGETFFETKSLAVVQFSDGYASMDYTAEGIDWDDDGRRATLRLYKHYDLTVARPDVVGYFNAFFPIEKDRALACERFRATVLKFEYHEDGKVVEAERPYTITPPWGYGETIELSASTGYDYRQELNLIDSTEELQALVQELNWKQISEEYYNKNMEKLAVCDEAFFERYTLAVVLFASGEGFPEIEFEDVRWLEQDEDGTTHAELLIREIRPDSMFAEDIYIEYLIAVPLAKSAATACDELTVRYLYGNTQKDGHTHNEPSNSIQSGEPMTYQKGTPVEITRVGTVWQSESKSVRQLRTDVLPDDELAYRLMKMLEELYYSERRVCVCEVELEDAFTWVPTLCVAGEYYITGDFIRCSRGQSYLTKEEKALIREVRDSLETTERSFYRAYDEALFNLRYDQTPSLFADGNTVLLTTAEQWEMLMSEIEPAFTFALLNEYDKDVQKMLADYSLILHLIPPGDSTYYSIGSKLWDAASDKATIVLHHDASGKSEREGYARLVCLPVERNFASELVSIEIEIDE